MAQLVYRTVQKPIEDRLIDAACIYWSITRADLRSPENVQRRHIVIYLIKINTQRNLVEVGSFFGVTAKSAVSRIVEKIDAQKSHYRSISEPINQIQHIASMLDSEFITVNIELHNKRLSLRSGDELPPSE